MRTVVRRMMTSCGFPIEHFAISLFLYLTEQRAIPIYRRRGRFGERPGEEAGRDEFDSAAEPCTT